jgi:hypothetical protein
MQEYFTWKEERIQSLKHDIFNRLSPMEFYLTQGKGTERPFTGDYYDSDAVGVYCCKVCTLRLFSSTHKYINRGVGHATFWNFFPFALNFYEDDLDFPTPQQAIYDVEYVNNKPVKRIVCSNVYFYIILYSVILISVMCLKTDQLHFSKD